MAVHYDVRYAASPADVKNYDTDKLRKEFLIENLFAEGEVNLIYSHYDRYITGGAVPVGGSLVLETIDPLKAEYFLERRELGVINVGGDGTVKVDGEEFELKYKEALYVGMGKKEIVFSSNETGNPANFYLGSAPAHKDFPTKKISREDAEVVELGSLQSSNARTINKMIVNSVVEVNQLQMGFTELKEGSVWNTMPCHTHDRRMEVYLYIEVPQDQAVCHFMGQTQETRHIWMKNKQAVISPPWSIHSGAGTSNYTFIWAMAGENLDYGDMDKAEPFELK
ncbi:MAG: 5-dehydro-4-deoxy-D-glucuronate isomerase [Candidatus Cyclobacteriaceae bacterium M3_2C_046]